MQITCLLTEISETDRTIGKLAHAIGNYAIKKGKKAWPLKQREFYMRVKQIW